jgi:CRISPR-associated protein Csb2
MPKIEGSKEKKTKIYDTFVNVSGSIKVSGDIYVSKEKREALKLLCERLGYLGRAESIVEATVSDEIDKTTINSYPLMKANRFQTNGVNKALNPMDNGSYEKWKNNSNIGESLSTPKDSDKKQQKDEAKVKKTLNCRQIFSPPSIAILPTCKQKDGRLRRGVVLLTM